MIKAKRSLGQNFLIDQNVIDKIINIIDIKDRNVLEIGPGTGSLTQAIIDKNPKKLLDLKICRQLFGLFILSLNS